MRQWAGGVFHDDDKDTTAFTGTSCRQKILRRVVLHNEDEHDAVPLAYRDSCSDETGEYSQIDFYSKEELPFVKCVYTYEDRYTFSRKIGRTDLLFDSHFESGNLCNAFRKGIHTSNLYEYDLMLNHDVHSKGHTQWFYFSVSNMFAGMTVKFNIGLFSKSTSLFNQGMRPLFYSEKKGKWSRCGEDILYCHAKRQGNFFNRKRLYVLTFKHQFEFSEERCFFAYSYPYTYSDLQSHLKSLQVDRCRNKTFRRSNITRTLAGNRCDMLTITEHTGSLSELHQRKGVFISARVHPGETVASWICEGIINFLTSDCDEARRLRNAYVFKVIPMLNPDGVINGNYRTSLSGVDLNRRWDKPSSTNHPTIFYTKRVTKRFKKTRDIAACCDIHGHSRREGIFMYGCPNSKSNKQGAGAMHPQVIPYLYDAECAFFHKSKCTYRLEGSKASTMRVVMNKEIGIQSSYTLEASLSGCRGFHFSLSDLHSMGTDFCRCLLKIHMFHIPRNDIIGPNLEFLDLDPLTNNTQLYQFQNDYDSVGSDSNPSEENLSEKEALQLLSKNQQVKQQVIIIKKSTKKKKKSNIKKKQQQKKVPCKVVEIKMLKSEKPPAKNMYNQSSNKTQDQNEKRVLRYLTFP